MSSNEFIVKGENPRIHKKELPEHGLHIVNSTDPSYENDVNEWLQDKQEDFRQVARALGQYSVFVKNDSNRDILGYKLNWELKMPDGTIVNYPRTYFTPTYLMGVPQSDRYDNEMATIKKNGKRFFTMIPTPFEMRGGSSGMVSVKIQGDEVERFQDAGRNNDMTPFIAKINEQFTQAADITVSVESALFDDGGFVGPKDDKEFIKMKAYVASKHDLLKTIKTAVTDNKTPLDSLFVKVDRIANQEVETPTVNSNFGIFYNFYRKLNAQEIRNSRQALNDDLRTINVLVKMLDHEWIIPFDRMHPENNK